MARPGLSSHRKFRRLTHALGSAAMARGVLELLWEPCYEAGDDYVGTAADIERLVGWNGERGVLTAALVDAGAPEGHGFIEPVHEHDDNSRTTYRVHDLWHHAPDYVMKRRRREIERRQKVAPTAKRRRTAPDGGQRPPSPDRQSGVVRPPAPAPAPAPAPVPPPEEEAPPLFSDVAAAAPADESPEAFQKAWNELTSEPIPRCRDLTPNRQKHAKARLRDRRLVEWRSVFQRINRSAFCRGENERGWKATFDWIVEGPDPAVKVLEGKYDDRLRVAGAAVSRPSAPVQQTMTPAVAARLRERGVQ